MKTTIRTGFRRWLSLLLALSMLLSLGLTGVWAAEEDAEETGVYTVDLSSVATTAEPGDTVALSAKVTLDGEEITDLDAAGLQFTFWADCWNDHTDGNSDATITDEHSLTGATATLPTEGTYYIVGELYDADWNSLASACVTITVAAAEVEEGYRVDVSGIATTAEPGDTVALSAQVYLDGEEITDLDAAGFQFTFWADSWNDHTDGNSDATISDEHSLTGATATLPTEGTYYIVGELYDADWNSLASACVTITVAAAEVEEGYRVDVSGIATTAEPGDTVALSAQVYLDGEEITDLDAAGLQFTFWADCWNNHTDGNSDATITDEHSLTGATATLPTEGTYYIVGELYDADWNSLASACVTITVAAQEDDTYVTGDLNVTKIANLSEDFIMGLDISSVVSEYASGVTFKDYDGNELTTITEFCQFLRSCGITHIRVRVWNDPFDSDGNGYGGGNNDVAAAVEIAEACANAGLKLLVDFHCSDFWADPSKQQAPKAWADYTLEEKETAVYDFIADALNQIAATGADVDMVQVGNETTGSFVGESGTENMCALFQSGANAVHDFNADTKVVIHITNPEKGRLTTWAKNLDTYAVDYDVLATSYYPYWHGTLDNLKSEMETVIETYGKDVMVAETSYAYTLEDSDGHDNTVREGNNDSSTDYAFTPQGQANFLRDLMAAVSEAGGLGVYYWEPAWITVGDTTGLTGDEYDAQVAANKLLWEEYGSGWASSYASEYDPDDAGVWYGGSAVDNQALFYPDGTPLASLHVWEYVKTGAVSSQVTVDEIEAPSLTIDAGEAYTLPDTVSVTYSSGTVSEPVVWDEDDLAAVDTAQPGTYVIHGTVSLSKEVTDGTWAGATEAETTCTLTVREANLITDADDAGLESGDHFTTDGDGIKAIPSKEDVLEGSGGLHWYNASATVSTVTYDTALTLEPGWYTFEAVAMGDTDDSVVLNVLSSEDGSVLFAGEPAAMPGWTTSLGGCVAPSVTFYLAETTSVQLQIELNISDGGWGSLDCLYLHRHASPVASDNGDGTHSLTCADCGAALGTEEHTMVLAEAGSTDAGATLTYRCTCGAEETAALSAEIQGLPDSAELTQGGTVQLNATFTASGLPAGMTAVGAYESGNPAVVTVGADGLLTAVAAGKASVTYRVTVTVTLPGGEETLVLAERTVSVTVNAAADNSGKDNGGSGNSGSQNRQDSPNTGDASDAGAWALLAVASCAAVGALLLRRKRG